jgi:hypothetical protein
MYEIQHITKEKNVLISGTREETAVADSAEHKQFRRASFPTSVTLTK